VIRVYAAFPSQKSSPPFTVEWCGQLAFDWRDVLSVAEDTWGTSVLIGNMSRYLVINHDYVKALEEWAAARGVSAL
jgi:hypothetical protein